MSRASPFSDPLFVQRTLEGFARQQAAILALFGVRPGTSQPDLAALREPVMEQYRRLFLPPGIAIAGAQALQGATSVSRLQQAADRFGRIATAIALDASQRFLAALRETGPDAPPITRLRELHELWIECGEAAYAAAAHGEEFASAQAELLAAMTEVQAATQPS
jgi:Poly(R)-hydroxyalkanoic acid synthase subunit (PHA_synth_III_E)